MYDVMIQGGEVIDPATDRYGRHDVAVREGRIAAIAPDLPAADAARVVDARGQ